MRQSNLFPQEVQLDLFPPEAGKDHYEYVYKPHWYIPHAVFKNGEKLCCFFQKRTALDYVKHSNIVSKNSR